MTQTEIRKYLNDNSKFIKVSQIAIAIGMDVSNFSRFLKGELNLRDKNVKSAARVIKKMQLKKTTKNLVVRKIGVSFEEN